MHLDLDVAGRSVLVLGTRRAARLTLARLVAAGARTTLVATDGRLDDAAPGTHVVPLPPPEDAVGLRRLLRAAWLVVSVDPPAEVLERVERLAPRLGVLSTREDPAPDRGRVTLVGGGPGPVRLLTLEALSALAGADVVFHDRLGPVADLPALAPAAELVDVGKSPYHHPVDQRTIEELLVERARGGASVVRLKGGDPFVLGRGGEEVRACLAAGVPVRVVPGVSSAVAVPASCGIPVTHRGVSHAFTVISGHQRPSEDELAALARLGGTIVVLMGVVNLEQISAGLVRAGLDPATPAAVVERGFSDSQRSTFSRLGTLADDARRLQVASPAVVVVGEVVRLAAELGDAGVVLDGLPVWAAS